MRCPCCGQFVKLYKRPLNSGMARCLMEIYHMTQRGIIWIDLARILNPNVTYNREWEKLPYWGLIEKRDAPPTPGRVHNEYRLTDIGRDFIEHRIRIARRVWVFNRRPLASDGTIDIVEALGNKFSYRELMGIDTATPKPTMFVPVPNITWRAIDLKGDGKMADEQTVAVSQPPLKVKTMLPDSQFLICGQSATRKTSTASFFPKPMLVSMWDSKGQAVPYFKGRKVKNLEYDEQGTPYHEVLSPKSGQLLIRVEYYNDPDPVKPNALQRWIERMNKLRGESNKWRTYVLDSVTGMHHNAQIYMRRVVNKDTEVAIDKRMYWNINDASGMFLREQLYSRIPAMPCNVVVVAHIKEAYAAGKVALDRKVMRISAPGEISWELASQYPEVWFSYMEWDPNAGENIFYIRTEGEVDDGLAAKSQFGIKGPVEVGRGGIHRGYLAMCEAENSVGDNWVFN